MEIPKRIFVEMVAITKVFHGHANSDSTAFKNAVRRAKLLHRRLDNLAKVHEVSLTVPKKNTNAQ